MKIDISKISVADSRLITRQFLNILERDWGNPKIRAEFEKWKIKNKKPNIDNDERS